MKTKGFDKGRAQVGICIKFTTQEGKQKLLEHNRRFSKGNTLLPPIQDDGELYGSLAGSHYNLALRAISHGIKSPIGNLHEMLDDDENLKQRVKEGHRWWILPETISKEEQVDISLWRNMDQNEIQSTHEIEILQGIRVTAQTLASQVEQVIM